MRNINVADDDNGRKRERDSAKKKPCRNYIMTPSNSNKFGVVVSCDSPS